MTRMVMIGAGTTDWDESGRIRGNLDIPLNEKGIEESMVCAGEVGQLGVNVVYTGSDLSAVQTAQVVAGADSIEMRVMDDLRDVDQGLWQGLLAEQVQTKHHKLYRRWRDAKDSVCPPKGESLHDALQRAKAAVGSIIENSSGETVAVVTGRVLNALLLCDLNGKKLHNAWELAENGPHLHVVETGSGETE